MTSEKLITLAIHTFEKALPVKAVLEHEGIYVELNNVNLENPSVSAGVRIRVPEKDLPMALRIVENPEIFCKVEKRGKLSDLILVPVDFSEHSEHAANLAFIMANTMHAHIELLYSFIPPSSGEEQQLSDSYDFEVNDADETLEIEHNSKILMRNFEKKLRKAIKDGRIPPVKFSSTVTEGIPEEAILQYARDNSPSMIVMGTRGADKKKEELIGSVTAEVLDSCRVPAFTVPENISDDFFLRLRNVGFFCNLDQEDILALDTLHRMFPMKPGKLNVTLINIPSKWERRSFSKQVTLDNLLKYCEEHFPNYNFDMRVLNLESLEHDVSELSDSHPFDMVCMPNKKRNVFARFFNPSLAHKILFRADIPMMVIPV